MTPKENPLEKIKNIMNGLFSDIQYFNFGNLQVFDDKKGRKKIFETQKQKIENELMGRLTDYLEREFEKTTKELSDLMKASREEAKIKLMGIAEIYIGMDGFNPETAPPESYQQMKLKEMYDEVQRLIHSL